MCKGSSHKKGHKNEGKAQPVANTARQKNHSKNATLLSKTERNDINRNSPLINDTAQAVLPLKSTLVAFGFFFLLHM
jgi:hypothetical protein